MWALLSEWLKKAGMALKHVGLTISQNNRQGETHTWISQKETRENKQSPKFQGQALGLGRILCLICFLFLENDCSEKSLVDPVPTGLVPHFSFSMFQFFFVAERMWDPVSALVWWIPLDDRVFHQKRHIIVFCSQSDVRNYPLTPS